MSPAKKEPEPSERRGRAASPEGEERAASRPPVFLRTVYPLNPGIPHFMDFPSGWR